MASRTLSLNGGADSTIILGHGWLWDLEALLEPRPEGGAMFGWGCVGLGWGYMGEWRKQNAEIVNAKG